MNEPKKRKPTTWGKVDGKPVEVIAEIRLDELMDKFGWTQFDVSNRTGMAQGSISRLKTNQRFEIAHLILLAKAFNVSIDELFSISFKPLDGNSKNEE